MKLKFKTYGNKKQAQAFRAWHDDTVTEIDYGGAKGGGKSFLGCSLLVSDAASYDGTYYFVARSTLSDLRKFTIPSFYEVFNFWGLQNNIHFKYNGQDNYFEFENGSRIYLLEAKTMPSDPLFERFGSMQFTRGWIEEAGQMKRAAIQNLSATIGRWKNKEYNLKPKLLLTFNPTKGYLYKERYVPFRDKTLPSYITFITALHTDNKQLSDDYVNNLNKVLSKSQKERLLKGNWEYDDDPTSLLDRDTIISAFRNSHLPGGERCITVDVARFGRDRTVIAVWSGMRIEEISVLSTSSIPETKAETLRLARKYKITLDKIVADEDGVGGGLVDVMRCKGFVNNSSPIAGENFKNLRSQCGYKIAELINEQGFYINAPDEYVDEIIEELEWLKEAHQELEKKKEIVSKDVIKLPENLGRSPDFMDVILMRAFFEFKKKMTVKYTPVTR